MHLSPIVFSLFDCVLGPAFALPHYPLIAHREQRWDSPRRRRRGLALILGGIEGPSLAQHAMAAGLLRGGWRGAVEIYRWNAGIPIARCALNLMSRRRHARTTNELTQRILAHRRAYPNTPIALVAVSGGCWIVIRALEQLGPEQAVSACVLLAPAVSPACDLSAALAASGAGILSVHSPYDLAILGLGTAIVGTSDRRFGRAAGAAGFPRGDARLMQRAWRAEDARLGYWGSHCTAIAPQFIAREITPWLLRACAAEMKTGSPQAAR